MLDSSVCTSVATAVQLLNDGEVKCSTDIVVVWSSARGSYVALYREHVQQEILELFGPPEQENKVASASTLAPVVTPQQRGCGYPSKSIPNPPLAPPAGAKPPIIALDFDHTITTRHFYKIILWGFYAGRSDAGTYRELPEFASWCRTAGIPCSMPRNPLVPNDDAGMHMVLDYLDSLGRTTQLIRGYFLGGEARISMLSEWLRRMTAVARPVIITAGRAPTVARAIATAVPEWVDFFPSEYCLDVGHSRWNEVSSICARKLLIVRDTLPSSGRVVLVDDAISQDRPADWVLASARAALYEGLRYESGGLSQEHLREIERLLLEG